MLIFKTVVELQQFLFSCTNITIGFVPTMGALHQGHLSLMEKAIEENDLMVCSIFVNPTQFNSKEDLEKYPRHTDKDIALIKNAFFDDAKLIIFLPDVKDIYPNKIEKSYDFGNLSLVMEAQHRPGHFDGVGMVLERFFDVIQPTKAYFGEKDFQQLAVVRNLVKQLKLPVQIIGCPIVREANGLAMSSRNERLTPEQKKQASNIYKFLQDAKQQAKTLSVEEVKNNFISVIKNIPALQLEYLEIADGNTLTPITNWEETTYSVAFVAVFVGNVRLIDNVTLYS
ncbi:MAG: pantoate--beta-alanine ligase [Flavobacteriales bacterium]|nr:pantoate--beta-alanine ligase [Flavobacteriales bacterium]MCW8912445.1 pantoate--beta-alanine ligase [Flavobacteriales bacterium]MCW8936529.1 pantoate--beta-alanine ligase [Flavobacteriales bacterium]MCW8940796.1 pantoate--beta-alanine ligase [Flavobacteriales bacterium]MCW8969212.1 pantoate--beta-alanine ligase [Flavobacteriales bacterium]